MKAARADLDTTIMSATALVRGLAGLRILGGEECEDGLHMELDDGRTLIFTGKFVIATYRAEKAH